MRPAVNETGQKKIVLVHNTTRYLKLHYLELMQLLKTRNWDVVCVAPADAAAVSLEGMGIRCVDLSLDRRSMNPVGELRVLARLWTVMRAEKPGAVLNFSIKPAIYGSLAARSAGVKGIYSMITGLGYVFMSNSSFTQRVVGALVRAAYKVALRGNVNVFFQNPDDRQTFLNYGLVPGDRATVLAGTGIDTNKYLPRPAADDPGETGFLFVGRLLADKGIREYVDAARRLLSEGCRAKFRILGPFDDNPSAILKSEVDAWVREGIVEYLGETDDVAGVMGKHQVFVLPSYREGLPRATLEAMSMAKPIVTTDVPGCRETVVDGLNGFLVPPRDAAALGAAMRRFVEEPELVDRMGSSSREMVEAGFDVHGVTRRIVDLIERGPGK